MATKKPPRKPPADAGGEKAPFRDWTPLRPQYPDLTTDQARAASRAAMARHEAGEERWEDIRLIEAERVHRFCDHVFEGAQIDVESLEKIASALYGVLMGAHWDEQFLLPGRDHPLGWTMHPKDDRDMRIFMRTAHLIRRGESVVQAIQASADEMNTSYETARAAFYRWKKAMGGVGDPSDF